MSASFWGLKLQPKQTYTNEVECTFRICLASLAAGALKNERTSVIVEIDGESYVMCSLRPDKVEQQPMDMVVNEGEVVTFRLEGPNAVDLIGNYLLDDIDGMMGQDMDGEEDMSDISMEDDESAEEEDMEEVVVEEIKKPEIKPEPKKTEKQQKVPQQKEQPKKVVEKKDDKKTAAQESENNNKRPAETPASPVEDKKVKKEESTDKAAPAKAEPTKTTLPSGIVIEDHIIGDGQRAKNGKRVSVRYVGKLSNGKKFDENTKGQPFSFKLGSGEVIKGWDIGIQGMQVGGVRRLVIPPKLAYGAAGAPPDIPKNATLTFDVKLLGVK